MNSIGEPIGKIIHNLLCLKLFNSNYIIFLFFNFLLKIILNLKNNSGFSRNPPLHSVNLLKIFLLFLFLFFIMENFQNPFSELKKKKKNRRKYYFGRYILG